MTTTGTPPTTAEREPNITPRYSLENPPKGLVECRKTATIRALEINEPFYVDTQEGRLLMSPETCDDWDDGYVLAYPSDGSKPYAMSRKFFYENYENC